MPITFPALRRALLASAVSVALIAGGLAVADSATAATRTPVLQIHVSCAKALPSALQRRLFGRTLKGTTSVSGSNSTGSESTTSGAIKETGYRDCSWSSGSHGARVEVLPAGDKSFKRYRQYLVRSGSKVTSTSVITCRRDGSVTCVVDLLVHHVWVEAYFVSTKSTAAAERDASTLLASLRKTYKKGATGRPWGIPKSAWKLASTCAAIDPDDVVGAAGGMAGGDLEQGDLAALDSPVSGEVYGKVRFRSCDWHSVAWDRNLSVTFLPGATWAHPKGTALSASSIGTHVVRATTRTDRYGGAVLDVVTTGGWYELYSSDLSSSERLAAAQAVYGLVG